VKIEKKLYKTYYRSEIGLLEIVGTDSAVKAVHFIEEEQATPNDTPLPAVVTDCVAQLAEYFAGQRHQFSLKLAPEGTEFQQKVWQQLVTIPYGQVVSYLDIARAIGNEKAVRAVGAANGQNPISIIVPCHRVIGSNGRLTGYGGGLWRKAWLLAHEDCPVGQQLPLF